MSRWSANVAKEQAKLAAKEDNWKLAGSGSLMATRTRNGGNRNLVATNTGENEGTFADDSSSSSYNEEDSSLSDDDDDNLEMWTEKPSPSRLILEPEALRKLVESHLKCPKCNSNLKLFFVTKTIASSAGLKCCRKDCSFIEHGEESCCC